MFKANDKNTRTTSLAYRAKLILEDKLNISEKKGLRDRSLEMILNTLRCPFLLEVQIILDYKWIYLLGNPT